MQAPPSPPRLLALQNRQRAYPVDLRVFRRLASHLIDSSLAIPSYELCVHLVSPRQIARLNEQFLQHQGPTDVIAFDLRTPGDPGPLLGEIFICPQVAVLQSDDFHTTWTDELARYLIHGLLHLTGYDDLSPGPRRRMKRRENALLRAAAARFPLDTLQRPPRPA